MGGWLLEGGGWLGGDGWGLRRRQAAAAGVAEANRRSRGRGHEAARLHSQTSTHHFDCFTVSSGPPVDLIKTATATKQATTICTASPSSLIAHILLLG